MTWKVSRITHLPAGQLSICKIIQIKFGVESPLPKSSQEGFLHPCKFLKDVLERPGSQQHLCKGLVDLEVNIVWPLLHT